MGISTCQWRARIGAFHLGKYLTTPIMRSRPGGYKGGSSQTSIRVSILGRLSMMARVCLVLVLVLRAGDVETNPGPSHHPHVEGATDQSKDMDCKIKIHISVYPASNHLPKSVSSVLTRRQANSFLSNVEKLYEVTYLSCQKTPLEMLFQCTPASKLGEMLRDYQEGELSTMLQQSPTIKSYLQTKAEDWNAVVYLDEDHLGRLLCLYGEDSGLEKKMTDGTEERTPALPQETVEQCFETFIAMIRAFDPIGTHKNHTYSKQNLFQYLHNRREIYGDLARVTDNNGYSLLHIAGIEGRVDAVQVIFEVGLFKHLLYQQVKKTASVHYGLTVIDITVRLKLVKVQDELHRLKELEEEMTELHRAARVADLTRIKSLLKTDKEHLRTTLSDSTTPLFWAVTSGDVDSLRVLVESGGDVCCLTDNGGTLLRRAVSCGHSHLVAFLVRHCHIDPDITGNDKKAAIHVCIDNKDIESLKKLIEVGTTVPNSIVHSLVSTGDMGIITFVDNQANLNWNRKDQKGGRFPLFTAIQQGYSEIAKYLIAKDVDMSATDKQFRNVFHACAQAGKAHMINLLKANVSDSTFLSLINAKDKYLGGERCFLVRGRDSGVSAYHYVMVDRLKIDIFRKITQEGGSLDVANFGKMVLSGWGSHPSPEVTKTIEDRFTPCRITATSPDDMTPLHLAILKQTPEVALALIDQGCDVEAVDCFGLRPIHLACMRGMLPVLIRLVEAGADINVKDEQGRSPEDAARINQHQHILNYLKSGHTLQKHKHTIEALRRALSGLIGDISPLAIDGVRGQGKNVKTHVVSKMRDMAAEINELIYRFNTSPVAPPIT